MKYLVAILMVLVPALAFGAPFVTSDADTSSYRPDGYVLTIDGGSQITSPAQAVTGGVRLHYDVSGVSTGSHTVRIKAYKNDAVWGRLESEEAVFTFVRPAAPATPAGIGLSAQ